MLKHKFLFKLGFTKKNMSNKDQRQGKPIYEDGKIEVRTYFHDEEAHNLWVGDNYFLLQRGVLEEFVEKTPIERLSRVLDNYDPTLLMVLEESKISPEGLVLILARARINEVKNEEHGCHGCSSCQCKKKGEQ